jgi:hypothetical protein
LHQFARVTRQTPTTALVPHIASPTYETRCNNALHHDCCLKKLFITASPDRSDT